MKIFKKKAIFAKFRGCDSKIEPATPIWSLNFKRAWQAQFWSHTYEILENFLFYIDLLLILVPFFEIHNGVSDKNFVHRCHIHIFSHPCIKILLAWIHRLVATNQGWLWRTYDFLKKTDSSALEFFSWWR